MTASLVAPQRTDGPTGDYRCKNRPGCVSIFNARLNLNLTYSRNSHHGFLSVNSALLDVQCAYGLIINMRIFERRWSIHSSTLYKA